MGRHLVLTDLAVPREGVPRILDATVNGWLCAAWPRLPVEPALHLVADIGAWSDLRLWQEWLERECGERVVAGWRGDFDGMVTHELEMARLSAELVARLAERGAAENAARVWVETLCRVVSRQWRHHLDHEAAACREPSL